MMSTYEIWIRRLATDLASPQSRRVLGRANWARLCRTFGLTLPAIARGGLRPLDRRMGKDLDSFDYRGRRIRFDCPFADRTIQDGTYAFGIVREILIRDCYLKHLPPDTLERARTVVDVGANRGMFTMLAATWAERVLSVDANPAFVPVIEHNARANGFGHVSIETAVIGRGGVLAGGGGRHVVELLDAHGLDTVDLLKIDIEGSEFALFERSDWLARVSRLCMEVHPRFGQPERIAETLEASGFSVARADGAVRLVGAGRPLEYLYAWRGARSAAAHDHARVQ